MAADWFDGAGGGSRVDPVELLTDTHCNRGCAELVATGALVSFSLTSDGGALGITVTVDGRWRREYVRTVDELQLYLAAAIPAAAEARGVDSPSAVPRQRARRSK